MVKTICVLNDYEPPLFDEMYLLVKKTKDLSIRIDNINISFNEESVFYFLFASALENKRYDEAIRVKNKIHDMNYTSDWCNKYTEYLIKKKYKELKPTLDISRRLVTKDSKKKLKIRVISGYHPGQRFYSKINHNEYCLFNDYDYIYDSKCGDFTSKYMRKLESIYRNMDGYDWIFWIDDDAFFTDFNIRLESFIELSEGCEFIVCKSPDHKELFTKISSGSFLLKCSEKSKRFILKCIFQDLNVVKQWWYDSLGFFTNGDQDSIIYVLENDEMYKDFSKILRHTYFNSRPEEYKKINDHFLVHLTAKDKQKELADFCLRMNLDETLIQKNLI